MRGRAFLALLLAVLLLLAPAQALAAEPDDETPPAFVDDEELNAVVKQAIEECLGPAGLSGIPIGIAVTFTRSGESWFYNSDEWFYTASLYKLPLVMRYSQMVENGELEDALPVFSEKAEYIKQRCLIYSDNGWAGQLWSHLFSEPGAVARNALAYAHFPEDELPADFYGRLTYSPRFMLGILQELYSNPDAYPNVLDYMHEAQPGEYFRAELEGSYEVAQKYGSAEGSNHTAGVIYTPSPILLVVMSYGLGPMLGDRMIGHVSAAIADYALRIDERAEAWERKRAEELAAVTPEPTPSPTPAPTPAPTPEPVPAPEKPQGVSPLWALLLIPAAGGAWIWIRAKKRRSEEPHHSESGNGDVNQ